VFPLVMLAAIGLSAGVVETCRALGPGWRAAALVAYCAAGIAWSAWSTVAVWPHGLCYTNELWGGTDQGYRHLSDSNYDWGQGLKELARWQSDHQIPTLAVWYFGTDLPLVGLPMRRIELDDRAGPEEELISRARGRYLAASTTLLYGSHTTAGSALRRRSPVDRTMTFFIYDLTGD
jgi:hypothetical protein